MKLNQNQKQSAFVLGLMLLGILYMSLSGSAPGTPEAVVEHAVKEMVEGVEKKQLDPFRKHLSESVRDQDNRTKEEILQTLRAIYYRYPKISLSIINLDAESGANPDIMVTELNLLMGAAIPEERGNFVLTFRREGQKWLVWEVDWRDGSDHGI